MDGFFFFLVCWLFGWRVVGRLFVHRHQKQHTHHIKWQQKKSTTTMNITWKVNNLNWERDKEDCEKRKKNNQNMSIFWHLNKNSISCAFLSLSLVRFCFYFVVKWMSIPIHRVHASRKFNFTEYACNRVPHSATYISRVCCICIVYINGHGQLHILKRKRLRRRFCSASLFLLRAFFVMRSYSPIK